jgi:quercetin dioxygenase-like cupin family protein
VTPTARAARLARGTAALRGPARLLGTTLVLALGLAGCAQPGQLGHPLPAAAPAPAAVTPAAAPPAPPATPAPVEPVSGTVDSRVTIRTPGPAVYSVRTVVLAPGESVGWVRHPGTVMAVVRTGTVSLVRQGACAPVDFAGGQALFIGDAVPHRLANPGTAPAELVVTMLLAPGAPESTDVAPACGR